MALEGDSPFRARDRQRQDALTVANAKRSRKARLKKLIRSREIDAVEVLEGVHPEWDEALSAMKVDEFLKSIPRVGKITMQEVAYELGSSLHLRIRALPDDRRGQLVQLLRMLRGDNVD